MAALTTDRKTRRAGSTILVALLSLPVAAGAVIYNGALVAVNQAGYAVPASADASLTVVGVAAKKVDNTGGAAGAKSVDVERGSFDMANSGTTDALTIADIGQPCYAVDDQTVARTSAAGLRPRVGRVVAIDGTVAFVEVGAPDERGNIDLPILAGEDLSADQYKLVKVGAAGTVVKTGAGEMALGVVQNAPANAAIAIVRTAGVTRCKADGTGVTRGNAISSAAAGVARASVAQASGLGHVNTGDAGAATDALIGAYILGIALETAAAGIVFGLQITHAGVCATTAI